MGDKKKIELLTSAIDNVEKLLVEEKDYNYTAFIYYLLEAKVNLKNAKIALEVKEE